MSEETLERFKKKQKSGMVEEVFEREIETAETEPNPEETEIVREIIKRDDEQIKKELIGETTNECFYQFKQGNRTITGLSIKGVNEIARSMGNIHVMEPKIAEQNDKYVVKVQAKDLLRNIATWGIAGQGKKMKTQYGEMDDEFALQKAFSKARRNALRQLIPETLISNMFAKWKEVNKQHLEDAKEFT